MSPIALPHTLDLCPAALLEKGVKWHRQGWSLIAGVILLRKICIALFPPLKRAKWTDFDFSWLRELKTREVALLPLWHFHHKLGGACWIQSLWAVKISGLNFIHLSNAQSLGPGDSVGASAVVSYMLFCCYSELAQVCPPQVREEALWNATSLCCLSC